jgi:hypothetical protein
MNKGIKSSLTEFHKAEHQGGNKPENSMKFTPPLEPFCLGGKP